MQKLSSSDFSAQKLGFTPNALPKLNNFPATQVNNVGGLKERKKEKYNVKKKNIEVKPKESNIKPAATNPNLHLSLSIEEPEEYKITPVPFRRQLSSTTTPPQSPKLVMADVHEDVKILTPPPRPHRAPPPVPIDIESHQCDAIDSTTAPEPRLNLKLSVANKRFRKVTFETEGSPEPPPVPPRSTGCTPTTPPVITVTQFPVPVSPGPLSSLPPVSPGPLSSPPPVSPGPLSPPFAAINPLFQSNDN